MRRSQREQARSEPPLARGWDLVSGAVGCWESGDDRLSRQRHYHGPGGLNGRVRNGNGWGPASMVAGKAAPRRSGRGGREVRGGGSRPGRFAPISGASRSMYKRRGVAFPFRWVSPTAGRILGSVLTSQGGPSRRLDLFGKRPPGCPAAALVLVCGRAGRGGQAIGCWNWSAATLARRALPAHRPGRLPGAFIACAKGNLVLEGASRLDAFSAYPVPT